MFFIVAYFLIWSGNALHVCDSAGLAHCHGALLMASMVLATIGYTVALFACWVEHRGGHRNDE